MKKKKSDLISNNQTSNNQGQDPEEIEEKLTEEFVEEENKNVMQVHSAKLKDIQNIRNKRLNKEEGTSDSNS